MAFFHEVPSFFLFGCSGLDEMSPIGSAFEFVLSGEDQAVGLVGGTVSLEACLKSLKHCLQFKTQTFTFLHQVPYLSVLPSAYPSPLESQAQINFSSINFLGHAI